MKIALILLCSLAAALSCGPCGLYPHGIDNDDTILTVGDDVTVVSYTGTFNYYGSTYSTVYISVNGPFSFNQSYNSFSVNTSPHPTPFLAAFGDDISLDNILGQIEFRNVTSAGTEFTMAADDLGKIGSTATIDYLIIVTWNGVQEYDAALTDPQNIFQVVLVMTTDGGMYAIFNYEQIGWVFSNTMVGFNKGDGSTITLHDPFTLETATNIYCPGRVVTCVDDANLAQPVAPTCMQLAPTCISTCMLGSDGSVTGYDGNPGTQLPAGTKSTLTNTVGDSTDPCKFRVAAVVDVNNDVEWVAVNLGVHTNPNRHKRTYTFNQFAHQVLAKGQGLSGSQVVTFSPDYSETVSGTTVIIEETANGWHLCSDCGFSVTVESSGTNFAVVKADSSYTAFGGPCGNP